MTRKGKGQGKGRGNGKGKGKLGGRGRTRSKGKDVKGGNNGNFGARNMLQGTKIRDIGPNEMRKFQLPLQLEGQLATDREKELADEAKSKVDSIYRDKEALEAWLERQEETRNLKQYIKRVELQIEREKDKPKIRQLKERLRRLKKNYRRELEEGIEYEINNAKRSIHQSEKELSAMLRESEGKVTVRSEKDITRMKEMNSDFTPVISEYDTNLINCARNHTVRPVLYRQEA